MSEIVKDFIKAVKEEKQGTSPYDTPATVTRVDGDTAWVHIAGGVDETPVKLTVNANVGDNVQVRVGGGKAWITGNATAPPTDDTRANVAHGVALKAEDTATAAQIEAVRAKAAADEAEAMAEAVHDIAEQAQQDAETASTNAQTAITQAQTATAAAQQAQNSLKSVVKGATTVEKAVSVMQTALEAVVDYDPTTDTVQEYFWHDANGAHVLGDTSGYRNDIASTGMKIVDASDEEVVSEFSADGVSIGKTDGSQSYLYEDYHSLQMVDKEGEIYFHISDLRNHDGNVVETFEGDGVSDTFTLSYYLWSMVEVRVDNIPKVSGTDYTTVQSPISQVIFVDAPSNGSIVTVIYATSDEEETTAKAFTFGSRKVSGMGAYSFVSGVNNEASGSISHAEGESTKAKGVASHTEGWGAQSNGIGAHAEGQSTTANGNYSHAEGNTTNAVATASHAEGENSQANGIYSHAEGKQTTAQAESSHAEGFNTSAEGVKSHAEGWGTQATEDATHSEGYLTIASGKYSHAQNQGTKASSRSQTALGRYNVEDNNGDYAVIVGNGTSDNARSNALTADWNGNVETSGDITDGNGNVLSNKIELAEVPMYVDTKANMTFAKITQALADGKSVFMFDGEYMYAYSSHDTTNDYYWFSRVYAHSGFQRWRIDSSNVWTDEGITNFADYVIEQGTSGIWRYRKWNSGVYECFGTQTGSIAVTTASAGYGGYRSGQLSIPRFPITFATTPTVTATVGSGSQGCWVNNVQPTTTSGSYYLSSGVSSAATNRSIQFQVMGRWK